MSAKNEATQCPGRMLTTVNALVLLLQRYPRYMCTADSVSQMCAGDTETSVSGTQSLIGSSWRAYSIQQSKGIRTCRDRMSLHAALSQGRCF